MRIDEAEEVPLGVEQPPVPEPLGVQHPNVGTAIGNGMGTASQRPQTKRTRTSRPGVGRQHANRSSGVSDEDNTQQEPASPSSAWRPDVLQENKARCLRDVRQAGKSYEVLFEVVESCSDPGQRRALINDVVAECRRFRKADLIARLEALL